MDIGATVCTKANPSCQVCPLNEDCMSAFNVEVEVKNNNKKPKKIMMMAFAIVQTEQSFLFRKNEMNSIWSSLWLPFDQLAMKSYMKELQLTQNEKFRHELTHRSLDLNVNVYFSSKEFDLDTNQKYEWIKKDRIDNYGMPKPITKLIQQL